MQDAGLLHDWVNRPDSLSGKLLSKGAIGWEDHCRWLEARLADQATRLWIIEAGGTAAGQVRLQDRGGGWEVDIYILPERRSGGLASKAVSTAIAALHGEFPGAPVLARVLPHNEASIALFRAVGFVPAGSHPDHLLFQLGVQP
jgi:RimJ/RimL family protein N-acetyltransferase